MDTLFKKCEGLPVGVTATAVGLATLSNAWAASGFPGVRHVTMFLVFIVWVGAMIKLVVYNKALRKEYANVVPASLYATYTMLTMILGSYIIEFHFGLGRAMWLFGVGLHFTHILIFTYLYVVKGVKSDTFLPSWFVTYMGFLVATVVGMPMGMMDVKNFVVYYGIIVYPIIFVCMLIRTLKKPYPDGLKLTFAIFFAPTSLLFVSYLNVIPQPEEWVVFVLYAIILATIVAVAAKMPSFLRQGFTPGHAALTFPFAIAVVASFRMAGFLYNIGMAELSVWVHHLFGLKLYATTAVIAFVAYGFLRMFGQSFAAKE